MRAVDGKVSFGREPSPFLAERIHNRITYVSRKFGFRIDLGAGNTANALSPYHTIPIPLVVTGPSGVPTYTSGTTLQARYQTQKPICVQHLASFGLLLKLFFAERSQGLGPIRRVLGDRLRSPNCADLRP